MIVFCSLDVPRTVRLLLVVKLLVTMRDFCMTTLLSKVARACTFNELHMVTLLVVTSVPVTVVEESVDCPCALKFDSELRLFMKSPLA